MAVPYFRLQLDEATIDRTIDVLRSRWLTTGPAVRQFEENFANFIGGGVEAVSVNSCTAGLHLALEAIGVGEGDEVITTNLTFTATAEVIRYLGATPVLVDCDLETLCADFDQIEQKLTDRTKAVIIVHFAGHAVDLEPLAQITRKRGIFLLEDAAHALPSRVGDRLVGNTGADASCFSFYANKTMTTGEGGMVVSSHPEILKRIKVMRLHGIDRDAFDRFTTNSASWEYDVVAPGFKYNMTDVAAATGLGQLKVVEDLRNQREAIARRYDTAFEDLPVTTLPRHSYAEHSWHLYVLQLNGEGRSNRDDFIQHLMAHDVGFSVHYKPLHLLTYWRDSLKLKSSDFPVSHDYFKRCVSIPIFPGMSSMEVNEVADVVKSFFEARHG